VRGIKGDWHVVLKQGIQPPMKANRTYEEALVTRQVVEQGAYHSVIVVTSPYHLRRVRMIFNKMFANAGIRLTFYPSRNKAFSMDNWWKTNRGRKAVIHEYLGLIYYGSCFKLKIWF